MSDNNEDTDFHVGDHPYFEVVLKIAGLLFFVVPFVYLSRILRK
jgi:hypothetical protein